MTSRNLVQQATEQAVTPVDHDPALAQRRACALVAQTVRPIEDRTPGDQVTPLKDEEQLLRQVH